MKDWKKTLPLVLFALAVVGFLFTALEEWVIDGGPIRYPWLGLAVVFFAIAVVFFVQSRKSRDETGPPKA